MKLYSCMKTKNILCVNIILLLPLIIVATKHVSRKKLSFLILPPHLKIVYQQQPRFLFAVGIVLSKNTIKINL